MVWGCCCNHPPPQSPPFHCLLLSWIVSRNHGACSSHPIPSHPTNHSITRGHLQSTNTRSGTNDNFDAPPGCSTAPITLLAAHSPYRLRPRIHLLCSLLLAGACQAQRLLLASRICGRALQRLMSRMRGFTWTCKRPIRSFQQSKAGKSNLLTHRSHGAICGLPLARTAAFAPVW